MSPFMFAYNRFVSLTYILLWLLAVMLYGGYGVVFTFYMLLYLYSIISRVYKVKRRERSQNVLRVTSYKKQ